MKKILATATMALVLAATGNVFAHGAKAIHGGIVQTVNDLNFELVAKDGKATIYVQDHDKEFSTVGATGKLTILNGAKKTEVPLEAAGNNLMVAKGDVKLPKGAKVVAAIAFENKKSMNVRFSVAK